MYLKTVDETSAIVRNGEVFVKNQDVSIRAERHDENA